MKKTMLVVGSTFSAISLSPLVLAASPSAIEMDSIVVTADPLGGRTADELISPTTVISNQDIERLKSTTLGETIDGLPGVTSSDFGPGVGRPVIRGFTGSRVTTLNNGLKTADVSGEGGDHNVALDPSGAQQIEVIRGPATLLYGGNASGGVINAISDDFDPEFSDKTEISGELGYGENGNQHQGSIGIALPISGNFVIRSRYNDQGNNDLYIDGFQAEGQTQGDKKTLQNSDVDTESFSVTGLYTNNWGFAALGYSRWESDYGIPEVFLGSGDEEKERIEAEYDRFDFRSEIYDPFAGFHTARLKLAYTDYEQAEVGFEFDDGILEESGVETEITNDEFDARLELVHNPIGAWEGVIGFQFNDRDLAGEGAEHEGGHGHGGFYVRDNETQSYSVFALENREVSFGRIEIAARLDYIDSEPAKLGGDRDVDVGMLEFEQEAILRDRDFTPVSISAGTIVPLNDAYHVRLALSRSQRAPSPEQLYAWGEHHAAGTIELGNPSLSKETYNNIDVGLDKHLGAFTFNITAFYNQVDDYIYLETQRNGNMPIEDDEGNLLVANVQNDAKFYGVEFTSEWRVHKGAMPVNLRLAGDYVRAKLDNGNNLPRISPARLGFGFDTSYKDIDFTMDYRHVFKQTKTADLESDTGSYNLVSFDANLHPTSLQGLSFFLKGRNLLNENGRRHQSNLKEEIVIMGRALFAGVNFDFSL
jgi:iron complex outermembrane receptor protein